MTLVKVIPDAQGAVVGMVVVTIDPEYFRTLLDSVRYAPGVLTYIAHGDGKLFCRRLNLRDWMGRIWPHLEPCLRVIGTVAR